jgi:hypothetical protein
MAAVEVRMTREPDDPVHSGVLHADGAVSLVTVELGAEDEMVVTIGVADGKRVRVVDER